MKGYDLYSHNSIKKTEIWRSVIGLGLFLSILCSLYWFSLIIISNFEYFKFHEHLKISIILLFSSFLFWHVSLFCVVNLIHKRSYFSLLGPFGKVNWQQFLIAIFATFIVFLISFFLVPLEILFFEKENLPERIMISFWEWLPWVFPACIVVFIQTSAEEMLFRGYLLQQLISRFKSFWVWAFFPSVLFGLGHFDYQSFGQNTYFYMVNAAIFGMLTSILTVKSKNLTYALGMHFFNNIIGVLFFGMGDNFSGLALINYYVDKTGIYMTYIIISQTLFHLITFLILFYWIKTYKSPL